MDKLDRSVVFENYVSDGQVKLSNLDACDFVSYLVWKELPFVVRYDLESDLVIVTDTRDDWK